MQLVILQKIGSGLFPTFADSQKTFSPSSFFYIACIYQKKVEMVNVSVRNIFLLYLHSH